MVKKVSVTVHPNSKKSRVERDLMENIHVYVNQPPIEGRANSAVVGMLAKYFDISKNRICLVSGVRSKHKVFEIG